MPDPQIDRGVLLSRLGDSLGTVDWAVRQIPERWQRALPTYYPPDAWTAAMNLAHLVVYEEGVAPMIEAIADGGDGTDVLRSDPDRFLAEARALEGAPVDELLSRLTTARRRAIAAVERTNDERLNEPATPLFRNPVHGERLHSLAWVAAKSFQHTWEHGNAILRVMLFAPDA